MKRIMLSIVLSVGALACGEDAEDDNPMLEVTVRGVVVDPDPFVSAQVDMSLSLSESIASAARANIPVAADIRPEVKVLTDATGAFELKVPANTKIRLVTFADAGNTYIPTSTNDEITVGTTDIDDVMIFSCSAMNSGPVQIAEILGVDLQNVFSRGYCAMWNLEGSTFPQVEDYIENTTITVNTPGFQLFIHSGLMWEPAEMTTAIGPYSLYAVLGDAPVTSPTDVSATFTDTANDPPHTYAPYTCRVLPGFPAFAQPIYPTN